jgi:transposase, IS5 family
VIEATVFRTISGPLPAWESLLPPELLRLPEELARVDALLDDPAFFAPFAPYFHPVLGRPSTPVECYLRLMFLKFRYRLGFESLCAEVSDSISWRRFCRIGLDGTVPHPTALMKLTTRCGEAAVAGLNEPLWAKAAGAKLVRTARVRADTTAPEAEVALLRGDFEGAKRVDLAEEGIVQRPESGFRADIEGVGRIRCGCAGVIALPGKQ